MADLLEQYDNISVAHIAEACNLPGVIAYHEITSTMDVSHVWAAEGAEAGTVILAERQTSGRGRGGKSWSSEAGSGLWFTVIERPEKQAALDVLSLRVGMAVAQTLDRYIEGSVMLKWPNDLFFQGRKLGGILIEARWRDERPEWVAIGVGINIRDPKDQPQAIGLGSTVSASEVLMSVLPVIRKVALVEGHLSPDEVHFYGRRDIAKGKHCVSPVEGIVQGISRSGDLIVRGNEGLVSVRSGSLILSQGSTYTEN